MILGLGRDIGYYASNVERPLVPNGGGLTVGSIQCLRPTGSCSGIWTVDVRPKHSTPKPYHSDRESLPWVETGRIRWRGVFEGLGSGAW